MSKLITSVCLFGLAGNLFAAEVAPVTVASNEASTVTTSSDTSTTTTPSNDATTTTTPSDDTSTATTPSEQKDPYETFNRVMYHFNDVLDKAILKPIATFYNTVLPKPVVKGISNFFTNIDTIPTVANDVLQGNFYQATSDGWRLVINTTVGILGFFDVASHIGLEPNKEDFGLTLAQWGYTNSNYLVLPFFGPSTPRDAIGLPVDYYIFSIYPHIHPPIARYELYGLGVISRRADLLSFQNVMEQAAIDKYVFLRNAYLQRRAYLIQRNKELGDPYFEKNKQQNRE